MGSDKALIELDGEPLVVRVARRLAEVSGDVFVVSKEPLEVPLPEVLDELAEQTPLSGIITALHAAQHDAVFVCGCDMPLIDPGLVEELASFDAEVVVPRHDGRLQPLHAVWSRSALPSLEAAWDEGERSVYGAVERMEARIVDVTDGRSFTNVNTPEELRALIPED